MFFLGVKSIGLLSEASSLSPEEQNEVEAITKTGKGHKRYNPDSCKNQRSLVNKIHSIDWKVMVILSQAPLDVHLVHQDHVQ